MSCSSARASGFQKTTITRRLPGSSWRTWGDCRWSAMTYRLLRGRCVCSGLTDGALIACGLSRGTPGRWLRVRPVCVLRRVRLVCVLRRVRLVCVLGRVPPVCVLGRVPPVCVLSARPPYPPVVALCRWLRWVRPTTGQPEALNERGLWHRMACAVAGGQRFFCRGGIRCHLCPSFADLTVGRGREAQCADRPVGDGTRDPHARHVSAGDHGVFAAHPECFGAGDQASARWTAASHGFFDR